MKRKKIKRDNLRRWLSRIAREYRLVAPVEKNVVTFSEVASGDEVVLDFSNSVLSPKGLFLPQTEELFSFTRGGGESQLMTKDGRGRETVVFGVRQCDVQSLFLLDKVFEGELEDSNYLDRRAKAILIGLACINPASTCFCASFGIDPFSPDGTDILLTDLGEEYLMDVSTERGVRLADLSSRLFSRVTKKNEKSYSVLKAEALSKMRMIAIDGIGEKLDSLWDDGLWSDLAQRCIGCGVCTYLCPTCHCFDIQDEDWGEGGMRFRCWDSCMFSEFTLMASGENPRPTKRERIRQRYFHKFKYFPDRYGALACVGWGRCISKCPVNIDMTQILSSLATESHGKSW